MTDRQINWNPSIPKVYGVRVYRETTGTGPYVFSSEDPIPDQKDIAWYADIDLANKEVKDVSGTFSVEESCFLILVENDGFVFCPDPETGNLSDMLFEWDKNWLYDAPHRLFRVDLVKRTVVEAERQWDHTYPEDFWVAMETEGKRPPASSKVVNRDPIGDGGFVVREEAPASDWLLSVLAGAFQRVAELESWTSDMASRLKRVEGVLNIDPSQPVPEEE